MIKLLLLTALSLTSSFSVLAADFKSGEHVRNYRFVLTDSSIKDEVPVNPREGFKNLFESGNASSNVYDVKLNPSAVSFVEDYMEDNTESLTQLKSTGKAYFDMMDKVLAKQGLPVELKYLSVIESQLKSSAVSWAGAVGPWQFMAATARNYGLKVNKTRDERRDYQKSTQAAAKYLSSLYGIYKDWLLVIAAYNCGPGGVNSAIRRSGSRNFWELQQYLPAESRNHVKKFIATHYIMEGQGGITTLTKKERETLAVQQPSGASADNKGLETISLTGKYNSFVIAEFIKMDISEFNRLNPSFDKQLAMNSTYNLRLPTDKALQFKAQKPQILEQSIRLALAMATL